MQCGLCEILFLKKMFSCDERVIMKVMKNSLPLRIKADHLRLEYRKFQELWATESVLELNKTDESTIELKF